MEDITLKIGKETNPINSAKSLVENVIHHTKVNVDVIGMAANYVAVKTFILAKNQLLERGYVVSFSPSYVDLTTPNGQKTAIRWDAIIRK